MAKQITTTLYYLSAHFELNGQLLDASHAESLGDAYGKYYTSEAAAEAAAQTERDNLADTNLGPSTEYSVHSVDIRSTVQAVETDDGQTEIECRTIAPLGDFTTLWYGVPQQTAAGADGLGPAGDDVCCWVDSDLARGIGWEAAAHVGREVLASVTA